MRAQAGTACGAERSVSASGATASTRTGTSLTAALPVSRSTIVGSVMSLTLAPALAAATRQPTPGAVVAEPVGDRDDAAAHLVAALERDLDRAGRRGDAHALAVA